jgi:hypothetical protein
MRRVPLTCSERQGYAYLRELRGHDEELVEDVDTWTAIALIDRLLVDAPGAAVRPGEACRLCAADRDRILAAIYVRELGARIQATPTCPACGKTFDIDFRLDELGQTLEPSYDGVERVGEGRFALEDGTCIRIPNGEDELVSSAARDPSAALIERCVERGAIGVERLGELLERLAPVMDLAMGAECAECGHEHQVRFDVQSFLLGRILAERALRASEVHRIARGYGWSLGEILSMPRNRRRSYVDLVEREART